MNKTVFADVVMGALNLEIEDLCFTRIALYDYRDILFP